MFRCSSRPIRTYGNLCSIHIPAELNGTELRLWQRQLCLPAMMRPRSRGGSWLRAARSDRVDTVARGLIAGPANLGSATGPVRVGDAQPHAAGPPGVGPCRTRQAAGVHGHSVRRSCRACESGSRAMPAGPDSSRRWYGRRIPCSPRSAKRRECHWRGVGVDHTPSTRKPRLLA